ncbi:CoF synthetase [Flagellimonas sp. 2504JD4-2]
MSKLMQGLRRKGYWLIDYISGRKTKSFYDEVKYVVENPKSPKAHEIRKGRLEQLLLHATNTTPFYKAFKSYDDLSDFPIINKNIILENYEGFKSANYRGSDLFKASSSGSTGIPFSIFQDKDKRHRNTADVIYFSEIVDSLLGNRLIYLKLWDHTNVKKKSTMFLQNILAHNVMDASDGAIEKLISRIAKDKSVKNILGYPSFFEEVCNYLDRQQHLPKIVNVSSIISFAESLKDSERHQMSKYFNAPIFERYSNQENGILAQQTKDSGGKYVLNWASYYFEILELDSDVHVKEGELGRVVVTDLFNFSMPMIRYDTGDMAIYEETQNGYPVLSKIYGRRTDTIYNTSGEIVSPFIFYMVLDFSKIRQFQFIQKGRTEYLFKLNGDSQDVQEAEIVEYFKGYLGGDAVIQFEYVQEIPLLSSGKRKKIVNEFIEQV